jgi:hypothetical protein
MKKIILYVLLISSSYAAGQAKYSNEFLAIGYGARAKAMGNAFVAIVDDATAGYWNPAGLTGVKSSVQIALMHSEQFAGIAKNDYLSVAFPIDKKSTLAFSYMRFGVDDIPNTTQLIDSEGNIDYDRITSFSAVDNAFFASYARKLNVEGLSIGGNIKIVRRIIGDFADAWGFGLDAGAQYVLKKWKFGATFRDFTGTFNSWNYDLTDEFKEVLLSTGNELPTNGQEVTAFKLILGTAWKTPMGDKFDFLVEIDLDISFDGRRNTLIASDFASLDPHLGVEFGFKSIVYIRAGVSNLQFSTNQFDSKTLKVEPSIGLGLRLGHFYIDYALTNVGSASGTLYSNLFSLKFDIFKKNKDA